MKMSKDVHKQAFALLCLFFNVLASQLLQRSAQKLYHVCRGSECMLVAVSKPFPSLIQLETQSVFVVPVLMACALLSRC